MLETERLLLRPMTERDAGNVFRMRRDEAVMRFIRDPQKSRAEAESWIEMISSRWASDKIGFCAVIEKRTRRFAGWCGLWQLKETGETEIGYALLPEFWGRGYAAEAARAFLRYAFDELARERVVAVAHPDNAASRAVMERIGMRYDCTGKFYGSDLVHYTITRDEYAALPQEGKPAAG